MKKVIAYARVSTDLQDTGSQIEAIKRYCDNQGWTLKKVYEDKGISGAKDDRPALNELKKDCGNEKRGFSAVVCFRFDRMARSTAHLLEILNLFQRQKIDFVSVNEGIDTSTPIGKCCYVMVSAISELERSIIQERVRAGLEKAKGQGVILGRPRKGFDINESLRLKKEGLSWSQLSKRVGVSSATLRRVLPPLLKNHESKNALKP